MLIDGPPPESAMVMDWWFDRSAAQSGALAYNPASTPLSGSQAMIIS